LPELSSESGPGFIKAAYLLLIYEKFLKTPDSGAFFMAVLPGDACIPAWQKREMTESG